MVPWRWQPTAPFRFRPFDRKKQRGRRPSSLKGSTVQVCASRIDTSFHHLSLDRTQPGLYAQSASQPTEPALKEGTGFPPISRRSHADRSSLAVPHCHSPPSSEEPASPLPGPWALSQLVSPSPLSDGLQPPFGRLLCVFFRFLSFSQTAPPSLALWQPARRPASPAAVSQRAGFGLSRILRPASGGAPAAPVAPDPRRPACTQRFPGTLSAMPVSVGPADARAVSCVAGMASCSSAVSGPAGAVRPLEGWSA